MNKSRAFKRFLTLLLIAGIMMSACAPAALASFRARVFTNTKVYSAPSTGAASINVPRGLGVVVTSYRGGWAQVKYNGHTGYMPCAYLNLASRLTAYTAKSTPVYSQPSSSSGTIGTLSIATPVYVVNKVNGYYRVQNGSGSVTGYVKSGYLTTKAKITAAYNAYKKAAAAKAPKKSSGGKKSGGAVAFMQSLVGRPYSASASLSSAPGSFNCSTFVAYVWEKVAGVHLKGTAAEQARDGSCKWIPKSSASSLRLGDVLCFDENGDGTCDHTAIYVGGNSFYEASKNAGGVHRNDHLNTSYYVNAFMGARRP